MTSIIDSDVKTNSFCHSKLVVTLLPMLMAFALAMVSTPYVYPTSNSSNMTTPATLEELNTEEFTHIVITSSQINELNSTINSAVKATQQGNTTEALLELKILQNQLDLLNTP